jgi:hypothetical protein
VACFFGILRSITKQSSMEVFFIRYRVLVTVLSVLALLYFPYELYSVVECFYSNKTGEGIGTLIDSAIALFAPVYLLVNVRRANKKFKDENAINSNNDNVAEL